MSWAASGHVRRLKATPTGRALSRTEKLLLLVLADYYNDEERCAWPSVVALAEDALSSRQWVMSCLGALVRDGMLEVVQAPEHIRKGQRWARQAYRFVGFDEEGKAVNSVDRLSAAKVVNSGAEGGQLSGRKAVNSGVRGKEEQYQPPVQPPGEPTGGNARGRGRAPAAPAGKAHAPKPATPTREALAAWGEACGWVREHVLLPSERAAAVGRYEPPAPELPSAVLGALRSVGAVRLREALLDRPRELGFCRREFLQAFAAFGVASGDRAPP